jgi:acetyltransferase
MSDSSSFVIESLRSEDAERTLPGLIALLQDAVDSRASIGFLPPLHEEYARAYWQSIFQAVSQGTCILLVARRLYHIIGTVQLDLATKSNASHRAEVQKLLVHRAQRRQGIGRALMQAIEQAALAHRRILLVLDTRQGDKAEPLYRSLDYHEAGVIPDYTCDETGAFDATVLFYKKIQF